MKRIWIIAGILFFPGAVPEILAQNTWTLEECIEYAHENNLQVKRQQLQARTSVNNLNMARAQTLPSLNAFASYSHNKGRALDPDSYSYVDQAFNDGNVGIQGGMDLFTGLYNYNNIRMNKYSMLAGLEEIESLRNEITLQIVSAYLQILLNGELLKMAGEQLEITRQRVERNRKLVEVGNLSRGELFEIEAQEAREKASLTRARNTLSISYLDLMQCMDLEDVPREAFRIEQPVLGMEHASPLRSVDSVYAGALRTLPVVKSAEYNLKSLQKGLSAVRGLRSPNISVTYLYYTLYSALSVNQLNPEADYRWQDQLRDKGYQQLSFSLTIPIANNLSAQNRISNARISVLDAQVNLDQTRQTLYKDIQQMYADASAALEDYQANLEAVESMEEAFSYAEQKYNVGLVSPVDYNMAKNNLTLARSDLLSAKYRYIFYTKVLDFWAGRPISL